MRFNVILEVNPDWNSDGKDREAHLDIIQRSFIGNLVLAIQQYNTFLTIRRKNGVASFNSNTLLRNEFLFAYHINSNSRDNVWVYKESAVIGKYSLEPSGYSGWSDISVNFNIYRDIIEEVNLSRALEVIKSQRYYFLKTGKSKYRQLVTSKKDYVKKYVFYPMQRRADPVAKHAFLDAIEVLLEAARIAKETKTYLYVKLHPHANTPAEKIVLLQLVTTNKYVREVKGDIHELNSQAHSVISCNSGASFEALIFDIPVFCFGNSEWFEATHKIKRLEDVKQAFSNEIPVRTVFQTKLIGYLLDNYWINHDDFNEICTRVGKALSTYQAVNDVEEPSIEYYIDKIHQKDIKIGKMKERQYLINQDYRFLHNQSKIFLLSPTIILYRFFRKIMHKVKRK